MVVPLRHYKELCELFAAIENPKEADMLLQDILTPQEVESIVERWQLVKQLASGKSQRDVAKDLKISISKITRGSRVLKYGTGGFQRFIDKLRKRHAIDR
ncbi:MAG: Trp family transcriptional regulator [Candidatus Peribacteraceae bacterium]|nr:Trp family transcriptional regulator [Candidatus Peribacteraceae bacterium]